MSRLRIALPATTCACAALGALMYAGTSGYDCVGASDTRAVAHPPVTWPWYLAIAVVAVAVSLVPLLRARRAS